MLKKVRENITKHHMIQTGDRVIVAVSGGPDSVALLKALELLSPEYRMTLVAAHLNHGLRGEDASRDEEFVKQLCREMGIECECRTADIASLSRGSGRSLEDLSREVRYDFLADVAGNYRADKIALGHNLHDQVETVIMNFLRGSGPGGLRGILPVREFIYVRPLFNVRRDEIITFLEAHGMTFMSDSSNVETYYLRNRIRNELIPELTQHYNPNLEHTLFATSEIMRLENDYMTAVTDKILSGWAVGHAEGGIRIRISALRSHHEALRNRIIQSLLHRFTPPGKGVGFTHIKSVLHLTSGNDPNALLKLPYGIDVRREYDWLVMKKREFHREAEPVVSSRLHYDVEVPGIVGMEELGRSMRFSLVDPPVDAKSVTKDTMYMDYEKVALPLKVRTVKPGDRIQPLGMEGSRKVKSYFIDLKIPRHLRTRIPLVLDSESVLWIAGVRMSERVKITDETRKILKIEFI
jgi:tRNA(Ile)-lysidine synthase